MIKRMFGCAAGILAVAGLHAAAPEPPPASASPRRQAASPAPAAPAGPGAASLTSATLTRYCTSCHSDRLKTGGLTLQHVDIARAGEHAEVLEKAVRKLRAGAMPPSGAPRPDGAGLETFISSLEGELDRAAAAHPNPGRTETFHRLNRTEYGNAIRDLLDLDLDVTVLVPGDESSFGFDNIAGVLKISPVIMERYASAAQKISRLAVGSMNIPASEVTVRLSSDVNQDDYQEGSAARDARRRPDASSFSARCRVPTSRCR